MTAVVTRQPETEPPEPQRTEWPRGSNLRALMSGRRNSVLLLGVLVAWVIVGTIMHGTHTLEIGGADQIGIQNWLGDRANDIQLASSQNFFIQVTHGISDGLNSLILWLQHLISTPAFPRPYPHVGFLGVVVIAWLFTAITAGWRMSILTVACFLAFALLGFWEESMDLLIVTLLAVAISVIVGIPMAILMARNKTARAIVTPVLDVMQTLPSFTYLLPLSLLFEIGPAAAVICTVIYSLPPVMRIASHGLLNVNPATVEATNSMGQTSWQRLLKVDLPMAKRTIIVGINQTTMAALSMATIAAFINGPGLGQPVVRALNALRVGDAFVPGLCIVLMAIMMDRVTTAASQHSENLARGQARNIAELRGRLLIAGAVITTVCVYLGANYTWAAKPPSSSAGTWLANRVQEVIDWISKHWSGATSTISDKFTTIFLNKVEYVVAGSPWFVTGAAILAIAFLLGGRRAFIAALICVAGLRWLGLWNGAMVTLTATLVATVFVMILAVVFGVWMGRSPRADQVIRPFLDAGQTLPPFVYLIPTLALFGPTRFTAIVAAVAYAAPAAIKIVADGIKAVSATTVEAAESAGALRIQIITKVQIPMARSAFTVAANQGLLYVLSMVVIGGLVGAGALGYDVVAGFKQLPLQGRGLAAGFSIVLLGVMLDRITTYTAQRGAKKAVES
jgi:glycine betaine/proline transport system permease protein